MISVKSIVEQFCKFVTVHVLHSAEEEKPYNFLINFAYLMNIKLRS